jgi:hypothetical protein
MLIAPDQFNLQHPAKLFENMAITFVFGGAIAFFAKLHTNPVPTVITTTVEKTTVQSDPPALVKTTVTESHTDGGADAPKG